MSFMAFNQYILTLVVRQEIKILAKTEQIFPNWGLSPNSGKSQGFCPIVGSHCLI
jgi:hypothetical protein